MYDRPVAVAMQTTVRSEGAKIEAPQAPRRVGAGGVTFSRWRRGLGRGLCPLPRKFLNFEIKMTCFGALWSMDFILNVPAREGS